MQTSNVSNLLNPRGTNLERSRRPSYTAEQQLFLHRLASLAERRQHLQGNPEEDHGHQHLIDKAIYSTYIDCLNLDLRDEARKILQMGERLAA